MAKQKREIIALKYAKLAKTLDKYPSRAELRSADVSRDMVRDHFGDMEQLRDYATEKHPEYFADILTLEYFNNDLYRKQLEVAKKFKVHVVTTAVAGAPVHEEFLASLLKFCDERKAALWVIPADYNLAETDKELIRNERVNIVFRPIRLNKKAIIHPIKIDPKQVDPAAGLDAFAHNEGTFIVGSPKQRRVSLANANGQLSPVIQATGAVTRSYYYRNGTQKRRDYLADKHHVMGAIVIEIKDEKVHFPRNVVMCRDGSFNDLYNNYASDSVTKIGIKLVKPGDWHVGVTDPKVRKVIYDVCKRGKPDYLVLEDFADFASINPHEEDNKVLRARHARAGTTSLRKEMIMLAQELSHLRDMSLAKTIIITESNHNDFLNRYLAAGRFDDENREAATELQLMAIRSKDPLSEGLYELYGVGRGKDLRFLKTNEEFRVGGVEQGVHGHKGSNGRRNPGAKGLFKAYGKVSFGHCHHGEIYHGAISSGTSTYMDLGYNTGASSWDNSFQIQHNDATRQLINIINGEYTTFY